MNRGVYPALVSPLHQTSKSYIKVFADDTIDIWKHAIPSE